MNYLLDSANNIITELDNYKNRSSQIKKELKSTEDELQDILHYCEYTDKPTSRDANKYWKQMGECRRKRRELKHEQELLDEYLHIITKVSGYFMSAKNKMASLEKIQNDRVYKVRVVNEEFGESLSIDHNKPKTIRKRIYANIEEENK